MTNNVNLLTTQKPVANTKASSKSTGTKDNGDFSKVLDKAQGDKDVQQNLGADVKETVDNASVEDTPKDVVQTGDKNTATQETSEDTKTEATDTNAEQKGQDDSEVVPVQTNIGVQGLSAELLTLAAVVIQQNSANTANGDVATQLGAEQLTQNVQTNEISQSSLLQGQQEQGQATELVKTQLATEIPVTEPMAQETVATNNTVNTVPNNKTVPNSIDALLSKTPSTQEQTGVVAQGNVQSNHHAQQMLSVLAGTGSYQVEASADTKGSETVNQLQNLVGNLVVEQSTEENTQTGQGKQQNSQAQSSPTNLLTGMVAQESQEETSGVYVPQNLDSVSKNQTTVEMPVNNLLNGDINQLNGAQTTNTNEVPVTRSTSDYNVTQQIVEQARLIQKAGSSEMVIKLNPEHLGELSLKVSVNGNGGVTATFHTDNAQVRAILETSMIQLKQQLNDQGLKVDSVEVQTGLQDGNLGDNPGSGAYQQGQNSQQFRSSEADLRNFEDTSEEMSVLGQREINGEKLTEGNVLSPEGVDYSV